jgi:predicted ABC-type ATPase
MAASLLSRYVHCEEFVNADDIARDLSASRPEDVAVEAGRLMLRRLEELAQRRADFAFETTLSARTFAPWLRRRKEEGFQFHLIFMWVLQPDVSVARVAARVAAGGHHIPEPDIRRRYGRGIANFFGLYKDLADTWEVYDNSDKTYELIAWGESTGIGEILNQGKWRKFNPTG